MQSISKILNFMLIILLIVVITFFVKNICFPKKYDANIKGKELNSYENVDAIYASLQKYIVAYRTKDYDSLNSILIPKIRKEQEVYDKISNQVIGKFESNDNNIYIKRIQKVKNTIYVVDYVISTPKKDEDNVNQKCLIKLDTEQEGFLIYYDSLLEKG